MKMHNKTQLQSRMRAYTQNKNVITAQPYMWSQLGEGRTNNMTIFNTHPDRRAPVAQ